MAPSPRPAIPWAPDRRAARRSGGSSLPPWPRLAVVAATMVVAWALAGRLASTAAVTELDRRLLTWVAERSDDTVVAAAHVATLVADVPVVGGSIVVVLLLTWRRPGWWPVAWSAVIAFTGSMVVTGTVKLLTDRPRPDDALVAVSSSAFPSGHSVRGAVLFGFLAWLVLRAARPRVRGVVAAGITVLVLGGGMVAASRVVLGAHWPSDVLGGVVLGIAWLVTSLRFGARDRGPDRLDVPGVAP